MKAPVYPPLEGHPLNPEKISALIEQQTNPIHYQQASTNIQIQYVIALPQISDQVRFEHTYEHTRPICSDHHLTSRFNIPGVGEFVYDALLPCCQTNVCCCCCCYWCDIIKCNPHYYPYLIYELVSGLLRIKFFEGGYGKIFYGPKLLGEIVQAKPNYFDIFGGIICSSYPQFHIEEEDTKYTYQLIPDSSAMPTCQYNYIFLLAAAFGFFRDTRPIVVQDYNGNIHPIKISNERNLKSKCRTHCFPCIPCLETPNYPEFNITFDPIIPQVERILTISALVMMSFYDHWAQTGFVGPSKVYANNFYRITTI